MFSIRQTGEHSFEVLRDGVVIDTVATRELAVAALTTAALATLERTNGRLATAPEGALPERWRGGSFGIVQAADTGDGRNFTDCVFSWRDPAVSLLPLMLQQVTEISHYAAELAGWMDELSLRGDNGVDAGGWFYANDAGTQFRDILRASGRFGVSVDPGEVEWEDVCTEMDPDGFYCTDGFTNFLAYQVIGLTGTPFPAFGNCYIELDGAAAAGEGAPADDADATGDDAPADTGDSSASAVPAVVAAGAVRATPRVDVAVFELPEPPDGDARYVPQDDEGRLAIPLTINEDGSLFAHGAAWGTCHIGYRDECVEPPPSPSGYAQFHLGANPYGFDHLPTGTLVLDCDHAHRNGLAHEARDHYANTAMAWADVRAVDGAHGIWLRGMVRPEVLANENMMRVLRASSLSGDWRAFGPMLDCVAFQSCSVPGFPIRRQALAAAGGITIADPVLRQRRRSDGTISELVGAGIVRPATVRTEALTAAGTVDCGPCARRSRAAQQSATPSSAGLERKLDAVLAAIGTVERRTRHLARAEQQALADQLGARR